MLISQYDIFDKPDSARPPSIHWTILDPTTAYANAELNDLAAGSIVIQVEALGDRDCDSCDIVQMYIKLTPTPTTGGYDGGADYRPLLDNVYWGTAAPVSSNNTYKRMPLGSIYVRDISDDDYIEEMYIKLTDTGSDAGCTDWYLIPIPNCQGSVVIGGSTHSLAGNQAVIVGGIGSLVSGDNAFIGGGSSSTATGDQAATVGGTGNDATGDNSFVGGGTSATASGTRSAVVGGGTNTVAGDNSGVLAGNTNSAPGDNSAVVGGSTNTNSGDYGAVVGGRNNAIAATSEDCAIVGGRYSDVNGIGAIAIGHKVQLAHSYAVLVNTLQGSNYNADADHFSSTQNNEFSVRAGYIGLYTNLATSTGMYLSAGGSSWNAVSDERVKSDIHPIAVDIMTAYRRLIPVRYVQEGTRIGAGVTAQNFYTAFDWLEPKYMGDMLAINDMERNGVQDLAIKELFDMVQELSRENARLASHIDKLEEEMRTHAHQ